MFNSKKTRNIVFIVIVLLIMAGMAFYFYGNMSFVKAPESSLSDSEKTLLQVGRLLILPTDEEPTIATVTDPEKLRSQVFFANATTGDKVLIYQKNQKVILYNPTLDRIIEVSPINLDSLLNKSN